MTEELSGVTAVIFIGCGVLTFLLLFIFAKRQIMRFAIRARRGPHVPIGHDAKKSLRRDIDRRIELIPRILYEPRLLGEEDGDNERYIIRPGAQVPPSYYRFKAVDDIKLLEREMGLIRHPSENVRGVLVATLCGPSEPLAGPGQKLVHQFCDLYEHARHGASDFGDAEYQAYLCLLRKLTEAAKLLRSHPSSHKSSPIRTPVKRPRPSATEQSILSDDTKHETTV
ncbi:hypothetical protein B566_EDAN009540 [Ephemera danica]|nr:hypothetical protein B566_EDAN009540 [Ephemera danica]